MLAPELIDRLIEFYQQCSNRGWCLVESLENKEFLTLRSSRYNFTHVARVYHKLPKYSVVSPRLASKNLKILTTFRSSLDSSRILSVQPTRLGYYITLTNTRGEYLDKRFLKIYTISLTTRMSKRFFE